MINLPSLFCKSKISYWLISFLTHKANMTKQPHNERLNIVLELLETEQNYTDQLALVEIVNKKKPKKN